MSTHFYIYGETLLSCLQLKSCLLFFCRQTTIINKLRKWEERLWLDSILHPLCSVFLSHCVWLTNAPLYKELIGSEQTARTINNENKYKCMLSREWEKRWAENNTSMDIKTGNILSFIFMFFLQNLGLFLKVQFCLHFFYLDIVLLWQMEFSAAMPHFDHKTVLTCH